MAKNTLTDRIKNPDKKPILNLTPLKKTAINTQTKEEYDKLMRVYEVGEWKWNGIGLPTASNYWEDYKKETCIDAEVICQFTNKQFYIDINWKIISTQEFYKIQKITPEMLKEINKYFEEKK